MKDKIANYIRAGYPGLFIITHEETRVSALMKDIAEATGWNLFPWSCTEGITNIAGEKEIHDTESPIAALDKAQELKPKSILFLRDFHIMMDEKNPVLYRMLRDRLAEFKASNRAIVIVGCRLVLPPELEKEITVIDFALPDREQLLEVLENVAELNDIKPNGHTDAILDAASGLTTIEAENAFALSFIEAKEFDPDVIAREKAATVQKSGLLEIIDDGTTLADIGGLDNLKADLHTKRNLFSKEAREYGLPTPRGQLYVGQPGTGKSLCARACHTVFGIPLVRLEAGRIFGSMVGESERNWRTAFATVKAVAPCVFWIDEVDGLFSGAESSGKTDGGTTNRVIKAILQDMQFNGDGIFFVFTANDIDGLPDPLIDRLDVWSVDLPNQTEREAIWKIHIEKRKRKPAKFDLVELARATDGFSGRQIEQVWLKTMTVAFNDKAREPVNADAIKIAKTVVPTSKTMADAIERRRKRLENRATPASTAEAVVKTGRKLSLN
jgi:SpoVK/Ycf46/Vps4 family AAA+-type ATPase